MKQADRNAGQFRIRQERDSLNWFKIQVTNHASQIKSCMDFQHGIVQGLVNAATRQHGQSFGNEMGEIMWQYVNALPTKTYSEK